MVFDIGMPNIAVNLLDGAFEMVKHKKETSRVGETRPCQRFKGGLNSTESLRIVEREMMCVISTILRLYSFIFAVLR